MTPDPDLSNAHKPELEDREKLAYQRREAEVRGQILAEPTRRHAWLNIAGPLGAALIGGFLAVFYLHPISVVRWIQSTELAWSGVSEGEVGLDEGLLKYYMTGGYPGMEPVILIHGLDPTARWCGAR